MRNLNGRLLSLKKETSTSKKLPVTFGLVYLGDDDWRENEKSIKEKYLRENGTMDGLMIVRHWLPEPLPLSTVFK